MSALSHDFRIDWSNNGVYTGTGEDVTTRVLSDSQGISVKYGRDQIRSQSPVAPGDMSFTLMNESKDYSPENGSSPIAGNALPGRPVKYEITHSSTTYTMFRGHLDQFDVVAREQEVQCSALDGLAKFRGVELSTPMYQGISTGEAIGYILDEIGWPAGGSNRDLDTGATQIEWWWEEGTDAFTALDKVLNSEGIPALVYIGADGKFVFRDRHHRIMDAASKTSQATFRDATTEPIFSEITYDHGWHEVINDVSIAVEERRAGSLADVWTSENQHALGASESRSFHVQTDEPFINAVTPVSGTDYDLVSGSVTVSINRTSGQSVQFTMTGGGSGGRIDNLKLRAQPVPVVRSYQVRDSDSTSITKYGKRSYTQDAPWATKHDAVALANVILLHRAERLPIVTITMNGGDNDTCMTQQLARDLSDRITIIETQTALNDEFYIEQIQHTIADGGNKVVTVFGCEKVPSGLPSSPFILGTSTLNGSALLVD